MLIQAEADANIENKLGNTALNVIGNSGNAQIIKVLLNAGAVVNKK